jgi:DNA repair protein RecO (recombination protein O)
MEWEAPAIILDVRPFGEADALATVMTGEHGAHRGLAHGGAGRSRAALWQPGNLVQVRWTGRLADQLGHFSAELIHPTAALVLDAPLPLAMLRAACAVAEGALPEREAHPRCFTGLLYLIVHLAGGSLLLAEQVRWELALLAELGYGLDLGACAVTGSTDALAYVSPRTGRALSAEGAGAWAPRMLPFPPFLRDGGAGDAAQWRDGLRLTGHFLARDVFGLRHLPLPLARQALYDRVTELAEKDTDG